MGNLTDSHKRGFLNPEINLIFLIPIPWKYLQERHHHFVRRLKEVVDELIVVASPPAYFERFKEPPFSIKREANVTILSLNWLPPYRGIFTKLTAWLNTRFLLNNLNKNKKYILVVAGLKIDLKLIDKDKRILRIVYDCADIMAGFNRKLAASYEDAEGEIVDYSDLVIVSSRYLGNKMKQYNKPVYYISNGVDYDYFRRVREEFDDERIKKQVRADFDLVLGYIGGIGNWFDFSLVRRVLNKYSNSRVVSIGMIMDSHAGRQMKSLLREYKDRAAYLGVIDAGQVPKYVKYFDYGLLPFRLDHPVVQGVNPLKLYEYFAMGKLVVGNVWKELMEYKKMGMFFDSEDFNPDCLRGDLINLAIKTAEEHDWGSLSEEFLRVIMSNL